MTNEPNKAAKVPVGDIPPLVPGGTASKLMMLRVLGSKLPISDASVSESATEAQQAMPRKYQSPSPSQLNIATIEGAAPLAKTFLQPLIPSLP